MKNRTDLHFAIIGLGAFGSELAKTLSVEGAYVIAIDNNIKHIEHIKDYVSDAICFDATDADLLENHGITGVDVAIIAIGESFEPNVLISMNLLEAGVKEIYARAGSKTQEQILKKIGITDVIHPERQVAERMGVSLVRKGLTDVFNLGEDLAVFEIEAPEAMVGYSLEELKIRKRYNLNLITIKRKIEKKADASDSSEDQNSKEEQYENIGILKGSTKVNSGDHFILVGKKEDCDKMMDVN